MWSIFSTPNYECSFFLKEQTHDQRDYSRGGWGGPCWLLILDSEVNRDSKRTNEKGPLLVGSWACRASTRDFCTALIALACPVQKYFFPRHTLFQFLCPHRYSKQGRQPCWVACLLVCGLCSRQIHIFCMCSDDFKFWLIHWWKTRANTFYYIT